MTNKQEASDAMLIERFNKGSIEAFEEIVSRYEVKVYNLALRFTRNQEDAEEVTQDVFSTLYRKLGGFEGKSQFSSWLYRIILNAAFMKLRKRKQHVTVSLEDLAPAIKEQVMEHDGGHTQRSDSITFNNELRIILESAVNKLPDQYRAVFVLRDVDGLSNLEVCKILDISIPAVKSRLHRSRLMLRKKLRGYYNEYVGKEVHCRGRLADASATA